MPALGSTTPHHDNSGSTRQVSTGGAGSGSQSTRLEAGLRLAGRAATLTELDPEGARLLAVASALRRELAGEVESQRERRCSGARTDPFAQVKGRSSLEQAHTDVYALLRCLDDELERRAVVARRG